MVESAVAATTPPVMNFPASSTTVKLVRIKYLLPDSVGASTVRITFSNGTGFVTLTMSDDDDIDFTLDPTQNALLASPKVIMSTGTISRGGASNTIPDGTFTVTLAYQNNSFDPAASVSSTNVTIDATPPTITRVGDTSVTITQGSTYTDSGATASDAIAGDLTSSIVVTNPVDTSVIGTYTVRYNVADAVGNNATEVTRTVIVEAPAPTPTVGPVTGSLFPAAANILMYVYRYDTDKNEVGYAEASCSTLTNGTFSCPVSAVGRYLVRPRNTDYVFTPTEAILLSGVASDPFSASSQPVTVTGCTKKDLSRNIQNANTKVKNLYTHFVDSLSKATTLAQKTTKVAQRTKLLAAIEALQNQPLPKFSDAIKSTEALPPIVLTCKRNLSCQKSSYKNKVREFQRNALALSKLITQLSQKVAKVDKGAALSVRITAKQAKLFAQVVVAATKLPNQTFSCS